MTPVDREQEVKDVLARAAQMESYGKYLLATNRVIDSERELRDAAMLHRYAALLTEQEITAAIPVVINSMLSRDDDELFALTEEALAEQWYFKWDDKFTTEWNLYQFSEELDIYSRRCRQWEQHHHGHVCVVERVREKYLMLRLRQFVVSARMSEGLRQPEELHTKGNYANSDPTIGNSSGNQPDAGNNRDVEALTAQVANLRAALTAVVDTFGPWHDEDCPEDDTCDCGAKTTHDFINLVLNETEGAAESTMATLTQSLAASEARWQALSADLMSDEHGIPGYWVSKFEQLMESHGFRPLERP